MIAMQAVQYLRRYFGYDSFRSGQEELVSSILQGRDVLGVMPTGAGKSVCYQVPAAMLPGVTLVVSPLISLMKDQVDALTQIGISTTYINSTLTQQELNVRFRDIRTGKYNIVYIAPERLESERFIRLMEEISVPLLAVDEAHCVSQWGHDFRPSYRSISRLLQYMRKRPVIAAFTATATDKVKDDIIEHLKLENPFRVTTGYARDNLTLTVVKGVSKRDYTAEFVRGRSGQSGIIYASTRKEVEETHRSLSLLGLSVGKYHAGLSDQERQWSQERFQYDDIQIMVATNAFGMGIDKSNVRYVLHYNLPRNIEAYYQEAGRAGRDGEPSECVLLFSPQDIVTQKFLIEQNELDEERKRIEYANLKLMVDYCHTTGCLQSYIIHYFDGGEEGAQPCGRCGSCTDDRERTDITEEAQKIFSCVVRMRQRFGVTLTAKVLRGANEAKIRELAFDRLPTYGALKHYKEKEIANLMHVLIADGYMALADGQYPTVALTKKAVAVLEGAEQVMLRISPLTEPSGKAGGVVHEGREELFDELRSLRKAMADKAKVPPFTIFHDATLREMCERLPRTEEELLQVKGVGENKLAKYGRAFLERFVAYGEKQT